MIKSITFTKNYELSLEKDSQKRWGVKTYKPTRYTREKKPWKMFTLFKKGLEIEFCNGVNVIVGENGSGKTTLFHLIHEYTGNEPDKLTRLFGDYKTDEEYIESHKKRYQEYGVMKIDGELTYKNTLFFSAEHDNPVVAIPKMLNPGEKNFMALTSELFDAQEESHGESMRPILEYLLKNASGGTLFFDEPETALSLKNQLWLVKEMKKSAIERNNQIIISTHALAIIQAFLTVFNMETREWVDRETYVIDMCNAVSD
jgi:predicted ATPase